jgi:arylsulfatase A-like enzyme
MIEAMDRQIGRVLQALDSNGLTENAIVIHPPVISARRLHVSANRADELPRWKIMR